MHRHSISAVAAACVLAAGLSVQASARADAAFAQTESTSAVLGTVRITHPVLANGQALPPGTYQLRVTAERPQPLPGQSAAAQRWVEFVAADGTVIGRDIAEIIGFDERPVGTSGRAGRGGTRVEMLRGGDFLRVSAYGDEGRYLIHLPVAP
jgi:hypothetical protein